MVREHHHQPGPDIFKRSASREHGIGPQCTELPSGTWPIPPLHPKRPLDRHQYDLRRSHPHPSSKTAQRPDQGERWSGTYHFSRLFFQINELLPRMLHPFCSLNRCTRSRVRHFRELLRLHRRIGSKCSSGNYDVSQIRFRYKEKDYAALHLYIGVLLYGFWLWLYRVTRKCMFILWRMVREGY